MTAYEALMMIARATFSPLGDREGFAGVDSLDAQIAEFDGGVIIIDGSTAQFMFDDGDFETFFLKG